MHTEHKKEILRTREVSRQKKLLTLQPYRLNKRVDFRNASVYILLRT